MFLKLYINRNKEELFMRCFIIIDYCIYILRNVIEQYIAILYKNTFV